MEREARIWDLGFGIGDSWGAGLPLWQAAPRYSGAGRFFWQPRLAETPIVFVDLREGRPRFPCGNRSAPWGPSFDRPLAGFLEATADRLQAGEVLTTGSKKFYGWIIPIPLD